MQAELQQAIEKGEHLYHCGQLEQAAAVFQSILMKSPDNEEALNNLGAISFNRGNSELAESYFLQSLKRNSRCQSAISNLIQLYEATGQPQKAKNLLRTLRDESPKESNTPNQSQVIKEVQEDENYLPSKGTFRAAFHEIDITPEVSETSPVLLQGLACPPRRASIASDPLKMQLLIIEDDHYTKILIVTADLLGFSPEMIQAVRNYAEIWGIEPAGIILNASHTHNAPGTVQQLPQLMGPYYADYARRIAILIQKNLQHLYSNLEKAQLAWSATEAQIGLNRRLRQNERTVFGPNPDAPYDRHTPIILVELTESDRKILLVRHSCHPTGLGEAPVISADFPGRLRETLCAGGHADGVMFLQGAAGTSKQTAAHRASQEFANSLEDVWSNGDHLAERITERLQHPMCPIEGPIYAVLESKQLKFDTLPSRFQIEQMVGNSKGNPLVREWARNLLQRYPQGEFPAQATLEIQAVRIGNELTFLTLPGEPTAELSQEISSLFPANNALFFLGYTNGMFGYLPTSEMIAEGGYECELSHVVYGWPSKLAFSPESVITDFVHTLPNAFAPKAIWPIYGRHHEFRKHQKAFFVLSTGRCGTMSLAHTLDTATNAHVFHQPQPDPIRESLQAYRGEIDKTKTFWQFRYAVMQQTWAKGLIYGETDHLMTQFSDVIAQELPEAKFIALVRDPRNFVRSGMRRKYYDGHSWDVGRLRPKKDSPEFELWNNWDPFEKVCWLWNDTYQRIRDISKQLGPDRVQFLRFEDFISDPAILSELFEFFGLEGYNPSAIDALMGKKLNAQTHGDFPPPQDWNSTQHDTLWRICGSLAKQFGYKRDYDLQIKRKEQKSSNKALEHLKVEKLQPRTVHNVAGHKGRIAKDSVISCPFTIGDYSNIMGKAIIKGNRACRIGRYCALGWGIHIITSHHDMSGANIQVGMQQRHGFRDIWTSKGDVQIGNNVWIGDNAVILSGIKVGDGAVIGAGSIVTQDVPPFGVAAGNPARAIKMRFSPYIIDQLLEIKWWDWQEERIARNRAFFDLDLTQNPNLDLSKIIVR